ncbi:MAG TPA: hypothetical protein VFI23_14710 [Rhizomicrobium sp.]|nr:hypothetical protein [Rhizomicrobium sp.]
MSSGKQHRRAHSKDKPTRLAKWMEECVPVTIEQFQLACKVAHAAATGQMPRQSFSSVFEEAKEKGEVGEGSYLIPADIRTNHAAFAVMDCVPEKTPEAGKLRRSLLWRTIFMPDKVFDDARAKPYLTTRGKQGYVGAPLIEAMATVPMRVGMEPPLDAIFARAEELAKNWDSSADPSSS